MPDFRVHGWTFQCHVKEDEKETVLQTFYIFFQEAERIEQVKQNKHAQKLNDILFLSREKP